MLDLNIVIENKKGEFESFEDEDDDGTYKYPLKGVTFPTSYGHIEGFHSEDDQDLDIFVGTGDMFGSFQVWRYEVPLETKFVMNVTEEEWNAIITEYKPVIKTQKIYKDREEFESALLLFKNK